GKQLGDAADRRWRDVQRAATRRSGKEHVASSDIGESRQLRDRFGRLEDEVPGRIALPHGAVYCKLKLKGFETVELIVLEDRKAGGERTEPAIALSLEELRLW